MKPLYKRYGDRKPDGTWYGGCAWFGACFYYPDEFDYYDCEFVVSWMNGENEWNYRRHKVYETARGRFYVRKGGMRIYLDEVLRTNIGG